ncbi:Serine/threonine protein phosphatase 5 [Giardia muris]|uniref:Serine/threonine-protein phosphatase n=1 Tax=Giardia muris TaxID=5742 RepID=A0A4Z1T2Z8_GIAMU|nr:Serine/threonine protein phosphatase 5 [Giardia muris]|eukprot:TNJ30028.1 Serine/threonine protein phosphatase 5 [Giardia muris]
MSKKTRGKKKGVGGAKERKLPLSTVAPSIGYFSISTQEAERRSRRFFGPSKRQSVLPTSGELAEIRNQVSEPWFKDIVARVRSCYLTKNRQGEAFETVTLTEIIPAPFIRRVLHIGTKLLGDEPNMLDLILPPTDISTFNKTLPDACSKALAQATMRSSGCGVSMTSLSDLRPISLGTDTVDLGYKKLILVGDTHGTFEVIERILSKEGFPEEDQTIYLFNGDYVDRGSFSVEIFIVLLALKIRQPGSIYLLRGNHETESVYSNYSFPTEIQRKYESKIGEAECAGLCVLFNKAFQALPLCALINRTYIVVHGGLPAWHGFCLADMSRLNRFREPDSADFLEYQYYDPLQDLLWADPSEDHKEFVPNDMRGISVTFGQDAARRFCRMFGVKYIIRSHTCVEEGWLTEHGGITHTLFSVPNYQETNLGAYVVFCGIYDSATNPNALEDYRNNPPAPVAFIRQFTCSQNAAIVNQPLTEELFAGFFRDDVTLDLADTAEEIKKDDELKEQLLAQVFQNIDDCDLCAPETLMITSVRVFKDATHEPAEPPTKAGPMGSVLATPKLPARDFLDRLMLVINMLNLTLAAALGCFLPELQRCLLAIDIAGKLYTCEELDIQIPDELFPPVFPESIIQAVIDSFEKAAGEDWLMERREELDSIFRKAHGLISGKRRSSRRRKLTAFERLAQLSSTSGYLYPFERPFQLSSFIFR